MMKADDKERVLPDEECEKVPKIEVYTAKALQTAKKPWFVGCMGIALASFAVILSLAVFVAFLGYMGRLPQKLVDTGIFVKVADREKTRTNICFLPKDSGSCLDVIPRWYFDQESAKCLQFVFSGCMGNANNFESEEACNSRCWSWGDDYLIPPLQDIGEKAAMADACSLEHDTGPCRAQTTRYYFDKNEKNCKTFTYGGCQGNKNNFLTERDCLAACDKPLQMNKGSDVCQLSPEVGTCRGSFEKWFFNGKSGQCEVFEYGGCDGNGNNFDTKEDCENRCKKQRSGGVSSEKDVCSLPSEIGPCRAAVPRFFFNGNSGKCEMFMFGGCSGNGNNFQTLEDCQARCIAGSTIEM